jgi:RHS repeat-associated protein
MDSAGSIKYVYNWGATGLAQRIAVGVSPVVRAYTFDPNGSLVQRHVSTNTLFLAISTAVYDGYGVKRADISATNGAAFNSDWVGYKGQYGYYTDGESGLIYCKNRYYDPANARWITRDPIGLDGGVNTYAYVKANPVMVVDPSGLDGLDDAANFFAGWGDTLSFGATGWARQRLGVDGVIDRSGGWYVGGQVVGTAQGFLEGGAGLAQGAKALRGVLKATGGMRGAVRAARAYAKATKVIKLGLITGRGETNAYGIITIAKGLSKAQVRETILHELVHRFFSIKNPKILLDFARANIGLEAYHKIALAKYLEELMPESYAVKNILKGGAFAWEYVKEAGMVRQFWNEVAGAMLSIKGASTAGNEMARRIK